MTPKKFNCQPRDSSNAPNVTKPQLPPTSPADFSLSGRDSGLIHTSYRPNASLFALERTGEVVSSDLVYNRKSVSRLRVQRSILQKLLLHRYLNGLARCHSASRFSIGAPGLTVGGTMILLSTAHHSDRWRRASFNIYYRVSVLRSQSGAGGNYPFLEYGVGSAQPFC